MTTLGQMFYADVTAPGRTMIACWRRGDVANAINAVHFSNLASAFHLAVERVAREAGVPATSVYVLLPDKEMGAAGDATIASQQKMSAVWTQHAGGLGRVFDVAGLALDVHFNMLGSGIGDAISALGNKFVQDFRLKEPYQEFCAAFATYDRWVNWAKTKIDEDEALREAHVRERKRRRVRRSIVFVSLLAAAAVGLRPLLAYVDVPAADTPPPDAAPVAAPSPLAPLEGDWVDAKGVVFHSVVVGRAIEFHLRDASKLPRHGFRTGDTRFELSALAGEPSAYAVEDHVQPVPPHGIEYDATATTIADGCLEIWADALGKPLHARVENDKLIVDIAKLDAPASLFTTTNGKVTACKALATAKVTRSELVLTRE